MVLSRVDERLEEVSDLLDDIAKGDERQTSLKRLCINAAEFQNDDCLDNRERAIFWKIFADLLQKNFSKAGFSGAKLTKPRLNLSLLQEDLL